MKDIRDKYDFAIIGGGLFGVYAAIYLAQHKQKVCLIEKEDALMRKASIVNQARLHGGYHYPRSVATALMSDDHKARFTSDHQPFINKTFNKYYAIDKFGSLTDARQFERFCDFVKIPYQKIGSHQFFDFRRLEAVYLTKEYSFDPFLIVQYYKEQLKDYPAIDILLNTAVQSAEDKRDSWLVELHNIEEQSHRKIEANQVINATYTASNGINQLFGQKHIQLMHEISEIVLLSSPPLQDLGLTIMDGQFASIMPYGRSGLLSLSAVAYTHHKVSYDEMPVFDCQKKNTHCKPHQPADCNHCFAQPKSNYPKMKAQIQHYLKDDVPLHFFQSLFTIKAKLQANYIDDGRPTEITQMNEKPPFYCIFAGKMNSIYEIEKVIQF